MEKKDVVCAACHGIDAWHTKHILIRWILGIIILAMVFMLGIKLGEFKSSIESGSWGGFERHHMMMYRSGYPDQYDYLYRTPPMMPIGPKTDYQVLMTPSPTPQPSPKATKAP